MVRNKHGWIRILEAVLAIMLITSVVLVLYTKQQQKPDLNDYVYRFQSKILSDISFNNTLRNAVFINDTDLLNSYAQSQLPSNFNFEIKICDINSGSCTISEIVTKDVYANEVIISTNLQVYSPKKVRLFLWEK
jgi:hypothetical protein